MDERLSVYDEKMQKSLNNLLDEFATIRAGRANPHVLDKLTVDYYGTPTPIQSVANVSVPEARMIQISPWEPSMIKEIEKALDEQVKNTRHGKRFMTIPGIKTVTAAAVVVAMPDPNTFRNGRAFASRVGLVPGFTGSGGKLVMLGITKRGDKRLRKLLVQAAITFANRTKKEKQPKYFERLLTEKPNMVAYVAIAAHLARSLWAMAKRGEDFKLIPEALQ